MSRHGTLSLSDFELRYNAIMSDAAYKSSKYDEEYEMHQMPQYLGGEALEVYRLLRDEVMEEAATCSKAQVGPS